MIKIAGTLIITALLLMQCAHVEAPSGGPKDRIPPQVQGVSPAPQTINAPLDLKPKFVFTEWIQETITAREIQINPPLALPPKIYAYENTLEIIPREPLDSAVTYTITLPATVKDLRGNGLDESFVLNFSTGPTIDSLKFQGKVYSKDLKAPAKTTLVGLYPLDNRDRFSYLKKLAQKDSLQQDSFPRVEKEPPLYTSIPDTSGIFQFSGIAPGQYLVLAFNDQNRDNKVDPKKEEIALPNELLYLPREKSIAPLVLNTFSEGPFYAEKIEFLGAGAVAIEFNQKLDSNSLGQLSIKSIEDSIGVPEMIYTHSHPTKAKLLLQLQKVQNGASYLIDLSAVHSVNGQTLDTNQYQFPLNWQEMPLPAFNRVDWSSPPPSYQQFPEDSAIYIQFHHPLFQDSLPSLFLTKETDTLAIVSQWINPFLLKVKPQQTLPLSSEFSLNLNPPPNARDTINNAPYKPQRILKFSTADPLKISALILETKEIQHPCYLFLKHLSSNYKDSIYLNSNQRIRLERMPEGAYQARYFVDFNGNQIREQGSLDPFRGSEPLFLLPDTLLLPRGDSLIYRFDPSKWQEKGEQSLEPAQ